MESVWAIKPSCFEEKKAERIGSEIERSIFQCTKRRSVIEACLDIVKALASGADRPTHLMYRANLSWSAMRKYLRLLEDKGYIKPQPSDNSRLLYGITPKGVHLLELRDLVQDLDSP